MPDTNAPSSTAKVIERPLGEVLRRAFTEASDHVYIVSPFVKRRALNTLLDKIASGVSCTVITRWRLRDFVTGASDIDIYRDIDERPCSRLLLKTSLHAKLYVVDRTFGIVGSSNCSLRGLALGAVPPNEEVNIIQDPITMPLWRRVIQLKADAKIPTYELYERFRQRIESVEAGDYSDWSDVIKTLNKRYPDEERQHKVRVSLGSLPLTRTPEELLTDTNDGEQESDGVVLHDLALLGADQLFNEEEALRDKAKGYLDNNDAVLALLDYCDSPRWFGEITEWLHNRIPESGSIKRSEVKGLVANTINWVIWCYPDRYRKAQPHHSVCFGPADSNEWDTIGEVHSSEQ